MSLWFKLWSLFYDPILSQWIMAFRVILDDLWMIYVWLNWIYDLRNLRNLRPKHLLCAKAFPVIFISLIFQEFHLPPNVPLMSDFHHVFPGFSHPRHATKRPMQGVAVILLMTMRIHIGGHQETTQLQVPTTWTDPRSWR